MKLLRSTTLPITRPGGENETVTYRADIDGLRAVSILLVVGYHAHPWLVPGGFIGVDIFFVISGFLITRIILSQIKTRAFSSMEFYARRIRRIFPALLVVLAATYLIGWAILLPSGFSLLGENIAAGVAFASNLFQLRQVGYFAPDAAENPLLHLWSLGIEEQFYIFWPPILLMMFGSHRRQFWMVVIAIASFGISLMIFFGYKEWSFYSPISRAWELLAGGIVANRYVEAPEREQRTSVRFDNVLAAIGLGTIAGAAIVGLIQFVPQVMSPVRQMIDMANMVNTLWPQVELAIQVLEVESEIKEAPNPQQLPPGPLPVEVEDLVYKPSPDGPPILQHLSVAVMPGEVWAISGRSGSGKSTLLNLMARLREYQSGTVRLGGCDIRNVAFASLRRSVGMVSQFPLIINDTARANLKLARADATDRELEAVCRSVGVWVSLQNAAPLGGSGLDAQLYTESNKGTLSGGQRRLFAIARALLNEPGLLILDEPTTGVDPLTRLPLENVVRSHSKGRTVIMVDQDPGFVAALADKVACLENGKVADVVSKAEFLTKPSLFLQLYKASLRSSEAQMRVVPIFDINGQSAAAADGQTKPQ